MMEILEFKQEDIREAAKLCFPQWGKEQTDNGFSHEFGEIMCEYIVRYGWYDNEYAWKIEDDQMCACIVGGTKYDSSDYDSWLDKKLPEMTDDERSEALKIRGYFRTMSERMKCLMNNDTDFYLSFFFSAKLGYGKELLGKLIDTIKTNGYRHLYLWTDSTCNHSFYDKNKFDLIKKIRNENFSSDGEDYYSYIYRLTLI